MICFGLESGNQRILDLADKRATVERARRAVELSKAAGIAPFGSFILGLPGETRETMEETVSFAQSLGIPHGFHLLSPFPGTRIRERASEYGIKILTDDWSLYDADHAVTETEALKAGEVEALAKNFFANLTAEIERMKKGTLDRDVHRSVPGGDGEKDRGGLRLEASFRRSDRGRGPHPRGGGAPAETAGRSRLNPSSGGSFRATEMPREFVEKILKKWEAKELIVCRTERTVSLELAGIEYGSLSPSKIAPSSITNRTACTRPQSRPVRVMRIESEATTIPSTRPCSTRAPTSTSP